MEVRGHGTQIDRDERRRVVSDGKCRLGVCGNEAACRQYSSNTFSCLCPHDSLPPTKDLRCPTRITVPLDPRPIQNILPPQINDTKTKNGTNKLIPIVLSSTNPPNTENREFYQEYFLFGGVAFILAVIFLTIVLWRRTKSRNENNEQSVSPSPKVLKQSLLLAERYALNPQYSACTATSVPLLKKELLCFLNEIGEGCFGKVYKGELHSEDTKTLEIVAIKVLKESASREAEEDFLREVDIMSAFKHANILSLLGVILRDQNVSPMMVFEYMPHGDLAEVLRCQKKKMVPDDPFVPILNSKELLSVALQIANGMKYLASQRFVHRDLACRNCLVADGPIVKIADFGMSRDVYTCDYYKIGGSRLLPIRWMSPESVMYGRFTLESDIWSYGIILWEIYSFGKQPYYGHTNEEVVKLIFDGIMLIPPVDCPVLICELMQNCWKTEPRDRIRFTEIHDRLLKSYENFGPCKDDNFKIENELRNDTLRRLPRPPPLKIPKMDLLDSEGYLLPKETEPVPYLETLPD